MAPLRLREPSKDLASRETRRVMPTLGDGPPLPPDRFWRRVSFALVGSIVLNIALWTLLSRVVRNHIIPAPPPITFKLITPPPPHKKVVHHKPPHVKPKPKPIPVAKTIPIPKHIVRTPPPKPMHQHILTATGPTQNTRTALPGGNAPVGVPLAAQQPTPTPAPQPPPVQAPPPKPAPTPPPIPPAPKPAPKPAPPPGPTMSAQPTDQVLPDIPSDLLSQDYSSFVRVKVDIAADGSFVPVLLTSSGDVEIDQRVLAALKKWKWKPALQDGAPVASVERFRFQFVVQ